MKHVSPFNRRIVADETLSFIGSFKKIYNGIGEKRWVIWYLLKRDLFASYKRSFLGASWILISPLMGMISWLLMNYSGLLNPNIDKSLNYNLYLLIGILFWSFFTGAYVASSQTIQASSGFALQISFPKELMYFKQAAQHLANFAPSFVFSMIIAIFLGIEPKIQWLLLPLGMLPLWFTAGAIGLIASPVAVVLPDIKSVIDTGMNFLFFITPVAYGVPKGVGLAKLFMYNPLTSMINLPRDILMDQNFKFSSEHGLTLGISFVGFIVVFRIFCLVEPFTTEKLG
ncbi:MAG: ABC transporter permease [Bdellovibrionales bacterium]|nr:ABC transporter permease [Bdellovibrionales bacterium]